MFRLRKTDKHATTVDSRRRVLYNSLERDLYRRNSNVAAHGARPAPLGGNTNCGLFSTQASEQESGCLPLPENGRLSPNLSKGIQGSMQAKPSARILLLQPFSEGKTQSDPAIIIDERRSDQRGCTGRNRIGARVERDDPFRSQADVSKLGTLSGGWERQAAWPCEPSLPPVGTAGSTDRLFYAGAEVGCI